MAVPDSFGWTLFVALACCFMRSPLVFGNDHVHKRSLYTGSCSCKTSTTVLTCTAQPTGCDGDEKKYGESCYRIIRDRNEIKSRVDAHRDCIARNSHLVYIESAEEQNFLAFYENLFYQNGNGNDERYWTGLLSTNNYIWLDGSPFNDIFTIRGNARLGCVFASEVWIDGENLDGFSFRSCGQSERFICEFPSLADVCQDEARARTFGESCYVLFDSPKAQDEAQQVCQTVPGGHLVYIESQDELEFIQSLWTIIQDDRYWIGLMTQHVWLDGSNATYQAFESKSHNDGGECFRMHPDTNFKWNDESCGNRYAYVCERELMVPEMQDIAGEACQTPVISLNGLLESGALCVREAGLPVYSGEYFLCPCGKENCIKGCGCSRPNSGSPVMCNCGLCNLTFTGNADVDTYMGSVYKEWQVLSSTFLCKCHDATTAEAAEYYRFEDGAFSSLNSTCQGTANTSGAVAGAVVAVVIFLVIIVAIVIVVYRKGGKKYLSERKKRVSKQSGTTTADNTGGNRPYEYNLPSGAHRNPAFAASLDSPGQDEEYTYIAPTNAEAGQQSDKPPGQAGTPSAQGLPRQPPPAVAPYRPTPKTGDTSDTDLEKARVDRGPNNAPAPDQGYTSLTQPSETLDSDADYQALNTDPLADLPSYPEYDPYNHLKFAN